MYEKVVESIVAKLQSGVDKGNMVMINRYMNELFTLAIKCRDERSGDFGLVTTRISEWLEALTFLEFPKNSIVIWQNRLENLQQ